MTNDNRVIVHPDRPSLAAAVAARFLTKLTDILDEQDEAHVCLTGGTVGTETLAAIADSGASSGLDWSRVHFWWGDERFVAADDADRNAVQAREAMLSRLPIVAEQVHEMPASDAGMSLDEAAAAADSELAAAGGEAPLAFDITFLGLGPDAHVASLFPGQDGIRVRRAGVIAVRDSPKPPPERLSLTLASLNASKRIWVVAAGPDKAAALGLSLAGADSVEVPAAGVRGRKRTVFFVDAEAAEQVPAHLMASEY